jgi:hypothetical protein
MTPAAIKSPAMLKRSIALLIVLSYASAVYSHHSLSGVYDSGQSRTLEAAVIEFEFVNPHPFITVEMETTDGNTERWRLEMDNRYELAEVGFTEETLKPGDRIKVTGELARRERRGLYVRKLERLADGFTYEHT